MIENSTYSIGKKKEIEKPVYWNAFSLLPEELFYQIFLLLRSTDISNLSKTGRSLYHRSIRHLSSLSFNVRVFKHKTFDAYLHPFLEADKSNRSLFALYTMGVQIVDGEIKVCSCCSGLGTYKGFEGESSHEVLDCKFRVTINVWGIQRESASLCQKINSVTYRPDLDEGKKQLLAVYVNEINRQSSSPEMHHYISIKG